MKWKVAGLLTAVVVAFAISVIATKDRQCYGHNGPPPTSGNDPHTFCRDTYWFNR